MIKEFTLSSATKDTVHCFLYTLSFRSTDCSNYLFAQILKGVITLLYHGMSLPDKPAKTIHGSFAFRLKIGDYEVEINGSYENVLNTIKDLPNLVGNIDKAFERAKPKKVATLTVKTESAPTERVPSQQYPQIPPSEKLDEAILKLLKTDWGKWRPRTIDELSQALEANGIEQSMRHLGGALMDLVKKDKIKRWNTNAGYVYIMAEKEALRSRGDAE